jgi:hypothetical protein
VNPFEKISVVLRAPSGRFRPHSLRKIPQGASSGVFLPDKEFLPISPLDTSAVCPQFLRRLQGSDAPGRTQFFQCHHRKEHCFIKKAPLFSRGAFERIFAEPAEPIGGFLRQRLEVKARHRLDRAPSDLVGVLTNRSAAVNVHAGSRRDLKSPCSSG